MCLGIPGKVVRWIDHDPMFGRAEIEFDSVRQTCHMACVSDAVEGDYVIVHAGIAISRIDEVEAQRVLEALAALQDPPPQPMEGPRRTEHDEAES
jgi:hydrogenase expression/formation protein HypC